MNPVLSVAGTTGEIINIETSRGVWTAPPRPGNMNSMSPDETNLTGSAATDILTQVPHIVDQARAGDRNAFTTLVNLFHGDIYRMVYYRTRSRMDAEDLTQEIFMKAFKTIAGLRDGSRFKSWLFAIAVNGVHDFHRKKKLRSLLGFAGPVDSSTVDDNAAYEGCDASDTMIKRDFWKEVTSFADGLPRMEREVFLLRFMDDLSIRDITRVLNKNENTVKTHLYRAVGKFRTHGSLRHYCEEEGR